MLTSLKKLKCGKAAGIDGISSEHLLYSHPALFTILMCLFNACIKINYIPDLFGRGLLIPLFKGGGLDKSKIENYRGITISSIFSKLFEMCLLNVYLQYFETDDLQFGFKSSTGCRDAILTARSAINYMTERGCTVNVCSLDLSKAFDKVDLPILLSKLMERHIPKSLIALLLDWYGKCFVSIKWEGIVANPFKVDAGVRQGGILSPFLFAVYINDVIVKLRNSGFGLCINNTFVGCIIYADDVLLLSNSVFHLQKLVDVCASVISALNMSFNVNKSCIIRIGNRFNRLCAGIVLNGQVVVAVSLLSYLGVSINSGRVFTCDFSKRKASFYRAFNTIYSRSKAAHSELISVFLLNSICLPILNFALEAILPSKSVLGNLNRLIDNALKKIFGTLDNANIRYIRWSLHLIDVRSWMRIQFCKFLRSRYLKSGNVHQLINKLAMVDYFQLLKELDVYRFADFYITNAQLIYRIHDSIRNSS
jgi:hypothetical protein